MFVKTTVQPSNADSQKYDHFPFWAHLMFIFEGITFKRKETTTEFPPYLSFARLLTSFCWFCRVPSHNPPTAMPMLYLFSQVPFPEILTLECLGLFWSLLQFAEGFGSSSFSNTFPNRLSAHFLIQGHDRGQHTVAGTVCKRTCPFVTFQNRNFAVETAFRACPCRHGAKWQQLLTSNPIWPIVRKPDVWIFIWHLFLGDFIGKQKQACRLIIDYGHVA